MEVDFAEEVLCMRIIVYTVLLCCSLLLFGCTEQKATPEAPKSSAPQETKASQEEKPAEMKTVSKSTGLGDTLTYYVIYRGDNAGDAENGSFMNGFLLPRFVNERAVEVRLAFEVTTSPRRTQEEAWRMIGDHIPEDAQQVRDFKADGVIGKEYVSKTLADVFSGYYKESAELAKQAGSNAETPGTFSVYLKYDKDGVYSATAVLGRYK